MNIVFWLLIIILGVILWGLLDFAFIPLGKMIYNKIKQIKNKMSNQEEKENE